MTKRYTIEELVRWSDIDRAGIIYYGQFLRFFEIAETELFRSVGLPYSEVFDRFDIWLPRVQIHFDFRKPLTLDDPIEVCQEFRPDGSAVARDPVEQLGIRYKLRVALDGEYQQSVHHVVAFQARGLTGVDHHEAARGEYDLHVVFV